MKKSLVVVSAVSAVALAPMSAQAFDFKISGQVNQAIIFGGDAEETSIVDNNTSGSRFRFKGSKEFGALKAGFRYEMQDQDNLSSSLGTDRADTEVRVSQVYVSGGFGKVTLGKGSSVSDGIFEAYGMINYMGGAESQLAYRGSVPVAYRSNDGLSRQNVLRYDSPKFNGFSVAAAINGSQGDNGSGSGVALRYKGKVAGGTLVAQIASDEIDQGEEFTGGSIGYKHSSGISASYSFADRDDNDDESDWLMFGYSFGNTTVSYGTGTSGAGVDNDMNIIGVNYKPTKGMEIYFNRMSFDNANGVEGDTFSLGSRVKF